jgi:hypothetical protein
MIEKSAPFMWPLFVGPSGKVISRSPEPLIELASTVFKKAIVLPMRVLSCSMLVSLSSNFGGSIPASLAAPGQAPAWENGTERALAAFTGSAGLSTLDDPARPKIRYPCPEARSQAQGLGCLIPKELFEFERIGQEADQSCYWALG